MHSTMLYVNTKIFLTDLIQKTCYRIPENSTEQTKKIVSKSVQKYLRILHFFDFTNFTKIFFCDARWGKCSNSIKQLWYFFNILTQYHCIEKLHLAISLSKHHVLRFRETYNFHGGSKRRMLILKTQKRSLEKHQSWHLFDLDRFVQVDLVNGFFVQVAKYPTGSKIIENIALESLQMSLSNITLNGSGSITISFF